MRETAGSAAAPAARCRKFRRGSFILNLPLCSHHSITSSASSVGGRDQAIRKLLTKSAPHVGQSPLACGLVASIIGCPCTLHALPDSIDRLRRYFSHPLLNGFQRTRCRLRARSGHGFRSRRGPVGSFCFEHGIDLCLHGGEVVPTWAAVTRRNRGGERSCCVHYYRLHSHNSPPQVRG